MKKVISILVVLIMLISSIEVFASGAEIECTAEVIEDVCTITGRINNYYGYNKISVIVGDIDDIYDITSNDTVLFIEVTEPTDGGEFSFVFRMPENTQFGTYDYYIGSTVDREVYVGTIEYMDPDDYVTNKFIDADMSISISGYVPTIAGTISCTEGKTVSIDILNKTNNSVVANDIITYEDGATDVSYMLSSLLSPKEYEIIISCTDGTSELMRVYANIDSAILMVEAFGEISPAENVSLDMQMESVGMDLLNQEKTITSTETFSANIPNIVSNCSINLCIQGYETVLSDNENTGDNTGNEGGDGNEGNEGSGDNEGGEEEILTSSLIVEGDSEDTFYVIANIEDGTALNNRIYKLIYNENHIEIISLFGYMYEDVTGTSEQEYIRILSDELGETTLQIKDMDDKPGNVWNGALNLFRFKFRDDYSGETEISINEWIGE